MWILAPGSMGPMRKFHKVAKEVCRCLTSSTRLQTVRGWGEKDLPPRPGTPGKKRFSRFTLLWNCNSAAESSCRNSFRGQLLRLRGFNSATLISMKQSAVTAGQRFIDARSPTFSYSWIVEKTFLGTDGNEYAQLVSSADPTRRKTLSTAVLGDRSWFQPA